MRKVIWIDETGYKRVSLIRDTDPDSMAQAGVPVCAPDLEEMDWGALKRELNNALVDRGLYTWQDVQAAQNGITSSVLAVFRKPLVNLYRYPQTTNSSEDTHDN